MHTMEPHSRIKSQITDIHNMDESQKYYVLQEPRYKNVDIVWNSRTGKINL